MIPYSQSVNELFDLQKYAIKLGLHNITALSAKLGNPHNSYPSIHIAGTNGKGSTAFYISKILQTTGLKVGLFTSPHLVDFRERIRIDGQLIDQEFVQHFWQEVKQTVHELKATFFDTTTLLAFKYFADNKVDVAIIETGLGGRLDSTNIIHPEIAVLTPIGFDHQRQLGKTMEEIAAEKAGIIKAHSDVICAKQNINVLDIFKSKIVKSNNLIYLPDIHKVKINRLNKYGLEFELENIKSQEKIIFSTPLPAEYQADNITLALLVCRHYTDKKNINMDINKIKKVISQSQWAGRLQLIQESPNVFFDVSHNIDGIKSTISSLFKFIDPLKTDLLLGIVNDKDATAITKYLAGKFRRIIVSEPGTDRRQEGEVLVKLFENEKQTVKFVKDLKRAYDESQKELKKEDTLIALGSHYLVGAIIEKQVVDILH